MNDETNEVEVNEPTTQSPSELDTLKARADQMGLKYHPNIGIDKLRAKIDNKLSGTEEPPTEEPVKKSNLGKKPTSFKGMINHEQFLKERTTSIKKNINRLVRVRVACMNPNKREWEGEIISVGSAKLGTYKKYVPFDTEDGYHVPNIIYNAMKERKFTQFYTVKGARGEKIRKGKLVPEFNIEVLPPLTKEQIKELAQRQAMAGTAEN